MVIRLIVMDKAMETHTTLIRSHYTSRVRCEGKLKVSLSEMLYSNLKLNMVLIIEPNQL